MNNRLIQTNKYTFVIELHVYANKVHSKSVISTYTCHGSDEQRVKDRAVIEQIAAELNTQLKDNAQMKFVVSEE